MLTNPQGTTVPYTHKDYMADVPTYRYKLRCGHETRYRTPVEVGGWGFCRSCREYWQRDEHVTELPPRGPARALSDMELADREDEARLKNRIADLLVWRDGWESDTKTVAAVVGTSERTVYRVQADMGLQAAA